MNRITAKALPIFLWALSIGVMGCDDSSGSGDGGDTDVDTDTDSDADTDTDSDTDTDADVWQWDSVVVPGAFTGHNSSVKVWAVSETTAAVCAGNMVDGDGGVLWFDGETLTVGETGFVCEGAYGLPDGEVWVFGYFDQTFDPVIYYRDGESWVSGYVGGVDDSCAYLAMYGDTMGDVRLVGRCGGDRLVWSATSAGNWVETAEAVPEYDILNDLHGAFSIAGDAVYYGSGMALSAGTDLGFPGGRALWGGGSTLSSLFALDGDVLHSYDGDAWSTHLECPFDVPDPGYNSCWRTAAMGNLQGEFYLGGGRGGNANEDVDNWRLNRLHDGVLTTVLAPCTGVAPRCGIQDMSRAGSTLFVVADDPQTRLMWHSISDAD